MAKKKMRSLLSQQREKLKAQKAAKAAKQAKAPKLPPGKKGGPIVKSQGGTITKGKGGALAKTGSSKPTTTGGKVTTTSPAKGPRGMRTRLPPGKAGGALAKKAGGALAKTSKFTGLGQALAVGATLGQAYKKTKRAKSVSSRGEGRATFNEKKKRMANIPPQEGTGKGSPTDKKPTSGTKTPKPTFKPATGASGRPSAAPKPAASKRSNTDVPSNAKSNPYRMPQGDERKDKSYKAVQELKGMIKASKARQNAQMPKKPAAKKKLSKNEQNLRRRRGM